MKTVGPKDFYQVKRMNQISDLDWVYATDFYLPLLGPIPFAVYKLLYENCEEEPVCHDVLFKKSQVSMGEFYHSLECLEALALVRTYYNSETADHHYFIYAMYAPKKPEEFLNDILLSGLLEKYIGSEEMQTLRKKYAIESIMKEFTDVSASFGDVYRLDEHDPLYAFKSKLSDINSEKNDIRPDFNTKAFVAHLKEYGIEDYNLSPQEKGFVSRLGNLYSVSPASMAENVKLAYDDGLEFGKRINKERLKQLTLDSVYFPYLKGDRGDSHLTSDTAIANNIKMMDTYSPIRYLSLLQKGTKPSLSDSSIAVRLVNGYGLSKGATNALMEYVILTNHGVLSWNSCEKLGAALKREGIKTALDAVDFLNKRHAWLKGIKNKDKTAKMALEDYKDSAKQEIAPMKNTDDDDDDTDALLEVFKK